MSEDGREVIGYDLRIVRLLSAEFAIDPSTFSVWTLEGSLSSGSFDSEIDLMFDGFAFQFEYAIDIRAHDVCGTSTTTFQRVTTPAVKYAKLSGCFIATAAFGSDLAPEVRLLRALRNAAVARSGVARAAVDLYERSSPPFAALLRRSEAGRALVRMGLRALLR